MDESIDIIFSQWLLKSTNGKIYKNEKWDYKLVNICDNYMTGCIKYSEYEYFDLKDSRQQNKKYSESEYFFTYW